MAFNKVAVIGLGYIGLPTAAVLASRKIKVVGVDINEVAVKTVNEGRIHIVEPDLDIAVRSAVTTGFLHATTKPEKADAFLVAVPTPLRDGVKPDISYVESAARAIAPVLEKGNVVILESTSPVGTTERMAEILAEERPDLTFPHQAGEKADINVAHCPERVLPGRVLHEIVDNDRIIGGMTKRCAQRSAELYKTFVRGECIVTTSRTAELSKLVENSFRDVNIAFANELSVICEKLEIDVWELIGLANRHPRVNILSPGPGVGGHCIAVDPWFIVDSAPEQARLIRTARQVNSEKPKYVFDKITKYASRFKEPVIACLGLSFKADIDDIRESPAVEIVEKIAEKQIGKVLAVEPNITELPKDLKNPKWNIEFTDYDRAIKNADIVVLLVDHREFKDIPRGSFEGKIVIDTRGVFSPFK